MQAAKPPFPALHLHMDPVQQTETDQPDDDEIDSDDEVEQARHDQDQDAGDQGHDGRDMRAGDDHKNSCDAGDAGNRLGRAL